MTGTFCPRIRQLEMVPIEGTDKAPRYVLRDPRGYAKSVVLSPWAASAIPLLNGRRPLDQIADLCRVETGREVSIDDLRRLVDLLDTGLFLENERFSNHIAQMRLSFQATDVRPAAHLGGAYAATPEALVHQIRDFCTSEDGPGALPWEGCRDAACDLLQPSARLRAVMSPHIDLYRGGATYAWAYDRLLDETDADLFIVLGTAHRPLAGRFSVSRKSFATPLGVAVTDGRCVDALVAWYEQRTSPTAAAAFVDDFPHLHEHSIELQAVWLQHALGGRRPYSIVPILVGSFHDFVQERRQPDEDEEVAAFASALRDLTFGDQRVCVIAGVDLAHVGTQFGDRERVDAARQKQLWKEDQHLLSLACAGDAAGWFDAVASEHDRNRICGLAPMYLLLSALGPLRGELLHYDQSLSLDGTCCVSFASAAFYRATATTDSC